MRLPYTTDLRVRSAPERPSQLARRVAEGRLALKDLGFVAVRLPLFLVSLWIPRRWDSHVAALAWKASRIVRPPREGRVSEMSKRRALVRPLGQPVEGEMNEYLRRRWELYWGSFRALSRRGWRADADWEGEEHLIRALEERRGVVLWFFSFCDNLIMLRALRRRGYSVVHLSRIAHGAPSKSRMGLAVLGGFARAAENRYLKDRVVIHTKLTPGSTQRLEQALADNGCVTIRGDQSATPGVRATLFGAPVCFAPGAPSLAWKSGAALLTVGLYRKGFDRYGIRVDPPIEVDRGTDRKTAVQRAVSVFAQRLEERVASHPDDWYGWEQDPSFWVNERRDEASLVSSE